MSNGLSGFKNFMKSFDNNLPYRQQLYSIKYISILFIIMLLQKKTGNSKMFAGQ